jgi:hypothetical protein
MSYSRAGDAVRPIAGYLSVSINLTRIYAESVSDVVQSAYDKYKEP